MKLSRDWATPLTIGSFALMATTGLLIFFHLDTGLNKVAHEWLGWLMVFAVAAHIIVNWPAFKRYLTSNRKGQIIIGLCLALLAASFGTYAGSSDETDNLPPPVLAMNALLDNNLSTIAPLTTSSATTLLNKIQAAQIPLASVDAPLRTAVGDDRDLQGKVMRLLFSATTETED